MELAETTFLEEEIARALRLIEQTKKVVVMQTESITAVGDTLKEVGVVLKELNAKVKGFDNRIKWLEARSLVIGGPLE